MVMPSPKEAASRATGRNAMLAQVNFCPQSILAPVVTQGAGLEGAKLGRVGELAGSQMG